VLDEYSPVLSSSAFAPSSLQTVTAFDVVHYQAVSCSMLLTVHMVERLHILSRKQSGRGAGESHHPTHPMAGPQAKP